MRCVVASLLPIRRQDALLCIMIALLASFGLVAAGVWRSDKIIQIPIKHAPTPRAVVAARIRMIAQFSKRFATLHTRQGQTHARIKHGKPASVHNGRFNRRKKVALRRECLLHLGCKNAALRRRSPPLMAKPEPAKLLAGKLQAHALKVVESCATRQPRGEFGIKAETEAEPEKFVMCHCAAQRLGHKPYVEQSVARDANLRTVFTPATICLASCRCRQIQNSFRRRQQPPRNDGQNVGGQRVERRLL